MSGWKDKSLKLFQMCINLIHYFYSPQDDTEEDLYDASNYL